MKTDNVVLPMSEDDLQVAVIDLCRLLRLRVAHFRPAQKKSEKWATPVQGDGAGFPDLVIVGPRGVLWRELKLQRGHLTPAQIEWQMALHSAGEDYGVWKPADWHSGWIRADLDDIRADRRMK